MGDATRVPRRACGPRPAEWAPAGRDRASCGGSPIASEKSAWLTVHSHPVHSLRHAAATAVTIAATGIWLLLYAWRDVVGHLSLSTNAFDLSVFDQALWSLEHGGLGFVSFMGQSIFSHHFMPILTVIAPIHALLPSPLTLELLQISATAIAALLLLRIQQQQGLDPWLAAGLALVFLLSRRTHGAVVGSFYPEAFQAPLTFAMVLLWPSRRWWVWSCIVLLLMTKEDAAIYVGAFAVFAMWRGLGSRRRAWSVLGLALVWFAFALVVAIPLSRRADGLSASNPLLDSRYGAVGAPGTEASLLERVVSARTARTVLNLTATAGFLPLAGLPWMAPAVPGLVANVAADPASMQSSLTGHYAWPVLPWVFLSASAGAAWLQQRSRMLALGLAAVLLVVTAADNPALQRLRETRIDPQAQLVRDQLRDQLARFHGETVLAQANLIPHLPGGTRVFAAGGDLTVADPDLVLLTTVGNLWPMTPAGVLSLVARYRSDPRYVQAASGPLFVFTLR